jgi:hypothetical protein
MKLLEAQVGRPVAACRPRRRAPWESEEPRQITEKILHFEV